MDKNFIKSFSTNGVVIGGIYVIYSMLLYVASVNVLNTAMSLLNLLFTLIIIILPQIYFGRKYRDTYTEGYIAYGRALLFGVLSATVAAFVVTIYTVIFHSLVDMSYLDPMINEFMTELAEKPGVTDQMLDDIYAKFEEAKTAPLYKTAFQAFLNFVITGGIFSLISSIFVKRKQDVIA